MRPLRLSCAAVLAAALASSVSACATVAPYQRGLLTRPAMSTEFEQTETSFRAHVHDSREGATGGFGSTGGGCGCN
ncbi:MAG: DUF4266 domain-containing protein [Deltaproteobacteria bacterium]|jgi:hypothetical protein